MISPTLRQDLIRRFGKDSVFDSRADKAVYACDASVLYPSPPDVVVLPRTTQQVRDLVLWCNEHRIPFTARGAGTGQSGGAITPEGGVLIGFSRLNRILSLDPHTQTAIVEPGVVNAALTTAAAPHGLFFAPDPSSMAACTLGGNVAENAGGVHCLKYGVTTDHVLGLEVVLPNGDVLDLLHSATPTRHQGLGANLVAMFCGSEGTLGVITKIRVALTPLPQHTGVFLVGFPTSRQACQAIQAIMGAGLLPSAMEFMDTFTVRAVNEAFALGFPEDVAALLLIELDGPPWQVAADHQHVADLLAPHAPSFVEWTTDPPTRQRFWRARKGTVGAYGRTRPAMVVQDTVIPVAALANVLTGIEAICEKHQVIVGNVFHAGDGNMHPNILFHPDDPDEICRVLAANDDIVALSLAVGGALTGEHGVGMEKIAFMQDAYPATTLTLFRHLQQALDPHTLANPAKLLPHRSCCGGTGPVHLTHDTPKKLRGLTPPPVSPHTDEPTLWV